MTTSANRVELVLSMKSARPRVIPADQREIMVTRGLDTRRRLQEFAQQFGLSLRDLRHLYVDGHMPIAIWQRFIETGIHPPRTWNSWIVDREDGHRPYAYDAEGLEWCKVCPRLGIDPGLYEPLPPPYWQWVQPLPKYLEIPKWILGFWLFFFVLKVKRS